MSSLQFLTSELLLHIIDNLQSHRDVANLSQQCRRIYHLCDMPTRREYRHIKVGSEPREKTLAMLLSILQTPRLGAYVQYLELSFTGANGTYICLGPDIALPPDDLERLKRAIKNAGFDRDREEANVLNMLLQELPWVITDHRLEFASQALAALIVSVSPRLETLGVTANWDYTRKNWAELNFFRANLFAIFLQRACSKKDDIPYMQRLRTIRFLVGPLSAHSMYEPPYYTEYDLNMSLNLVCRLPAIEEVCFDRVKEEEETYNSVPPLPGSGNYTSIVINNSCLGTNCVRNIIESARSLKKFVFGIGGLGWRPVDDPTPEVDTSEAFESLFAHRDTLEHLDINLDISSREHFWVRYSDPAYRPYIKGNKRQPDRSNTANDDSDAKNGSVARNSSEGDNNNDENNDSDDDNSSLGASDDDDADNTNDGEASGDRDNDSDENNDSEDHDSSEGAGDNNAGNTNDRETDSDRDDNSDSESEDRAYWLTSNTSSVSAGRRHVDDNGNNHREASGYSLRSFQALKNVQLDIDDLYYFACNIGFDINLRDPSFSLADYLPSRIEKLVIYDYDKDQEQDPDTSDFFMHAHIAKLVEEKDAKLPFLTVVEGLDIFAGTCMPDVQDRDDDVWEYSGK